MAVGHGEQCSKDLLKLKEKIDAIEIEIKNNGKNIDSIKEMVLDIHSVQVSPDSGEKSGIDNDEDIGEYVFLLPNIFQLMFQVLLKIF